MPEQFDPNLMEVDEVALRTHIDRATILAGLRRGTLKLDHLKIGKKVLVVRSSFEDMMVRSLVSH